MSFCPICREEYRPGFTRCADCGRTLVKTLDPLPVRHIDDAEAVLLCAHTDDFKAEMIVTALQNRGIPVLLETSKESGDVAAAKEFSANSKEIYVPAYLEDDAREVLDGIAGDVLAAPPMASSTASPGLADLDNQDDNGPYKATEDKRIQLSLIFGLITVIFVLYLYLTVG